MRVRARVSARERACTRARACLQIIKAFTMAELSRRPRPGASNPQKHSFRRTLMMEQRSMLRVSEGVAIRTVTLDSHRRA